MTLQRLSKLEREQCWERWAQKRVQSPTDLDSANPLARLTGSSTMTGYPSSLSPTTATTAQRDQQKQLQDEVQLHQPHALEPLAEDSGSHTPSHGGIVNSGHEYEMHIAPTSSTATSNPPVSNSSRPNAAQLSSRQRPVSMPAQQSNLNHLAKHSPAASGEVNGEKKETTAPGQETNGKHAQEPNSSAAGGRTASRNRVLGDYTLSKTLGAGSMGKVKLAHHNVTGEKVCIPNSPMV